MELFCMVSIGLVNFRPCARIISCPLIEKTIRSCSYVLQFTDYKIEAIKPHIYIKKLYGFELIAWTEGNSFQEKIYFITSFSDGCLLQISAAGGVCHLAAPATTIIFMTMTNTVLIFLAHCITIFRITWGRHVRFTVRAWLKFRT